MTKSFPFDCFVDNIYEIIINLKVQIVLKIWKFSIYKKLFLLRYALTIEILWLQEFV